MNSTEERWRQRSLLEDWVVVQSIEFCVLYSIICIVSCCMNRKYMQSKRYVDCYRLSSRWTDVNPPFARELKKGKIKIKREILNGKKTQTELKYSRTHEHWTHKVYGTKVDAFEFSMRMNEWKAKKKFALLCWTVDDILGNEN